MQGYRTDGRAVKRLRQQRGMTQIALAAACGFSNTWLSHVESGRRNFTATQQRQVADLLGVSQNDIQTAAPPAPSDSNCAAGAA